MAEDAQQVLTLLEDVKMIRMGQSQRGRNGKMGKTMNKNFMSPDIKERQNYF